MPNVLLEGSLSESTLSSEYILAGRSLAPTDGPRVQLMSVYRRLDGDEWLVEARVDEDGFVQHMALSIHRRPDNRWLIKPATIGFPRPTAGVREAVHVLAQALLRDNPGLRVVASGVGELTHPHR